MKNFAVWLDSENAHVFALKAKGVEKIIVTKNGINHHTSHKNDKHKDNDSEHYYKELAGKLKDADQLLLMGPGLAKVHFKEHLSKHQAKTLAKKIIGLENLESFEHLSEKQMMAQVHKFFKTYDLFN